MGMIPALTGSIPSVPVRHPREILEAGREAQVLGIDEVQFFDRSVVDVCQELASLGIRVIVAGLDTDYRAKPCTNERPNGIMTNCLTNQGSRSRTDKRTVLSLFFGIGRART